VKEKIEEILMAMHGIVQLKKEHLSLKLDQARQLENILDRDCSYFDKLAELTLALGEFNEDPDGQEQAISKAEQELMRLYVHLLSKSKNEIQDN